MRSQVLLNASVILVFDVGAKYFKYSLFNIKNNQITLLDKYIVEIAEVSLDIIKNTTQTIVEKIQISFAQKIDLIIVLVDTIYNSVISYSNTININTAISHEFINKLINHDNYVLDLIKYDFILDNNILVDNPINMNCTTLTYNYSAITTSKTIINNVKQALNAFSNLHFSSGIYNVAAYYKTLLNTENIIVIDIGYECIKLILLGTKSAYITLDYGISKLINQLNLKYKNPLEHLNFYIEQNTETEKFFSTMIKEVLDKLYNNVKINYYVPIYLVGGGSHIPFICEFLHYKTNHEYKYCDMYFTDDNPSHNWTKCFIANSYYTVLSLLHRSK